MWANNQLGWIFWRAGAGLQTRMSSWWLKALWGESSPGQRRPLTELGDTYLVCAQARLGRGVGKEKESASCGSKSRVRIFFFLIVSVLLSKIKREGEREGSEKRKQNSYWSAVLFSALWAVTRNIHRATMWEPWKVKREKTPWVLKENFLLIMHQGGSKAHKLHIQN